jgi:hypothetical protein
LPDYEPESTFNAGGTGLFCIVLSSKTAIDDIFVDSTRLSSPCTSLIVNSLSDHDAQFLTVNNINGKVNLIPLR